MSQTIEDLFTDWLNDNGDSIITDNVSLEDVVNELAEEYVKDHIDDDLMEESVKEGVDAYLARHLEHRIDDALPEQLTEFVSNTISETQLTAIMREECQSLRDSDLDRIVSARVDAVLTLRGYGSRIDDLSGFCDALQHKLLYADKRHEELVRAANINSVWNAVNTIGMCILAAWLCWVLF